MQNEARSPSDSGLYFESVVSLKNWDLCSSKDSGLARGGMVGSFQQPHRCRRELVCGGNQAQDQVSIAWKIIEMSGMDENVLASKQVDG